jgi:hypothetical protein
VDHLQPQNHLDVTGVGVLKRIVLEKCVKRGLDLTSEYFKKRFNKKVSTK